MVGAWQSSSSYDIDVLNSITNNRFFEIKRSAEEIIQTEGSPIALFGSVWSMRNRIESWKSFASGIFDDTLKSFGEQAITVLKEKDGRFEPSNLSGSSAFYSSRLKYSASLRSGIAIGLALISSYPDELKNCSHRFISVSCVHSILTNADLQLWLSLDSVLPALAEAAPEVFLKAVEESLRNNVFADLPKIERRGLRNVSFLFGVRKALEVLSWDEEFITRATLALSDFAKLNLSEDDYFIESLVKIFLLWLPRTRADFKKQNLAMLAIMNESPDVAWLLLLKLLPNATTHTTTTARPKFRNPVPDDWEQKIMTDSYWEQARLYSNHIVSLSSGSKKRLHTLLENIENLMPEILDKVMQNLIALKHDFNDEELYSIWSSLLFTINRHEKYSESTWAIKGDSLEKMRETCNKLKPLSPVYYHRILFAKNSLSLFKEKGNFDWRGSLKQASERRKPALQEILVTRGLDDVLQFAKNVDNSGDVGAELASIADNSIDSQMLPDLLDGQDLKIKEFVHHYVFKRYFELGIDWLDSLRMNCWSDIQIVSLFLHLPWSASLGRKIDALEYDLNNDYWKRVDVARLWQCSDSDTIVAIDELVRNDRHISAISCLYRMTYRNETSIDIGRIIDVLIAGITSPEPHSNIDSFEFRELVKFLQDSKEVSLEKMAKIELGYFGFFDAYSDLELKANKTLLSQKPELFNEMFRVSYGLCKPKSIGRDEARKLLFVWDTPIGLDENEQFTPEGFKSWLANVKNSFCNEDNFDYILYTIGQKLIYIPADTDGFWINKDVAQIINEKDHNDIRDGLSNGIRNSRGAYFVDPTGQAEKDIAQMYRSRAEETENLGYHRLADMLRDIAKQYDYEAKLTLSRGNERQEWLQESSGGLFY